MRHSTPLPEASLRSLSPRSLPLSLFPLLFAALLAALFAALLPLAARAAVPHDDAVPAYAEEQTILQTEKDAPEAGWFSSASGKVHMDRHFLGQYGATEANVILQRGGNTWRVLRNQWFATISGVLLLVVPVLILGFYWAFGPQRVKEPETGRTIVRFDRWQRLIHWLTAISFVLLALTGLLILFGKTLVLPWLGHDPFSWVALVSKYIHNFVGPLFILCSILMFFTFLRRNFFGRGDWTWLKKGGGLATHQHVPAGYFNAGEKLWFWGGVVLLGLLASLSGLVLDFTALGKTRYLMQMANYLHLASVTAYMALTLGHIYIGTIGTPGAYHAMRHGTVDEAWAREHHEYWYDEIKGRAEPSGRPLPPDGSLRPTR